MKYYSPKLQGHWSISFFWDIYFYSMIWILPYMVVLFVLPKLLSKTTIKVFFMKKLFFFTLLFIITLSGHSQKKSSISFEQWISVKNVSNPVISSDGKSVVYTVTSTDWANNAYDSELWLWRDDGSSVQLTRTNKGSSSSARFTPDGRFISFLADRGDKMQLYIIAINGGEAMPITKEEDGIGSYEWSPDGSQLIFTKTEPDSKKDKTIKEKYGAFGIEGEEYKQNHLWLLSFNYDSILMAGELPCYTSQKDTVSDKGNGCIKWPVVSRITEGDFTVSGFAWRPDGKSIAFNKQKNPLINASTSADIVLVDVATKKLTTLVSNPSSDFFNRWSPDGTELVYSSAVSDSLSYYYKNNRLFIYNLANKSSREIAIDIDENKSVSDWNKSGLFLLAFNKMKQQLYVADSKTGITKTIDMGVPLVNGLSFSKISGSMAAVGRTYDGLAEIFIKSLNQPLKKITTSTTQIAGWKTPMNEIVSWKSTDNTIIEGVLSKPANFDANKRYPLLVVIHGGPTGIDLPDPVATYVYPIMQWVEKGAIVLRVNYRGSAGYGEKFRSLNVRNLGLGDMWDVMTGVDYLAAKGMIDTSRMGVMGWSQGGYISAFLATNTNRFKAISVGAGISNWITYYVNTDITPFTRQYLQATPWSDMDIYLKTSPMTNMNKASTPTLIQHGEFDKRVPIPNAYELYRGLQDKGVPSKLIVYKGFGHGINKPKERLAAIWHNWTWFNKYVFGEEELMPN
jgi:dipeptidyl aminopeptidase/acylaminoacyl peptidase